MNRFTLTLFFYSTLALTASAQDIVGRVVDDKGAPLPYANVVLFTAGDTTFVSGTMTGEDGRFAIKSDRKERLLRVSQVGSKTIYRNCPGSEAGDIALQATTTELGEVVVKSSRPKIRLGAEGMETVVEGSILEKAGTIYELLDKLPNVTAQNEAIEVFGRGTPVIYVNGRQVYNAAEYEKLSADDIKSVEVIAHPGAKYPTDVKSVIRITTKKPQGDGFGFRTETALLLNEEMQWGAEEALNANYRLRGLDISAYIKGKKARDFLSWGQNEDSYMENTWHVATSRDTRRKIESFSSLLSANYQFNENHSVGVRVGYDTPNTKNFSDYEILTMCDETSESERTAGTSRTEYKNPAFSGNAYYTGKIRNTGIDFNLDWYNNNNNTDAQNAETSVGSGAEAMVVNTDDRIRNRFLASKLVLSAPLWGGNVSLGGEYSHSKRTERYEVLPAGILPSANSLYKENTTAVFVDYNRQFGRLTMSVGGRYENVRFNYYEDGVYMPSSSKNYNNFFPSVNFMLPVGRVQMQLSYTSDIQRPNYLDLRNAVSYKSRFSYESGNPFLMPEITRNLQYTASYRFLMLDVAYSHISDPIMPRVTPYGGNTAMSLTRLENIESFDKMQATLALQPTFGAWHPSLAANVTKQWFDMEVHGGSILHHPLAMFSFNNEFDTKLCYVGLFTGITTTGGSSGNYCLHKPLFGVNLAVAKTFLNERLRIHFLATDLFGLGRNNTLRWYTGTLHTSTQHNDPCMRWRLSFRYQFNVAKSKYKGTGAGDTQKSRLTGSSSPGNRDSAQ